MSLRAFAAAALVFALTMPLQAADSSSSTNAATVASLDASSQKFAPIGDVGLGSDGAMRDKDSYQVRIGELNAPGGEAYIVPLLLPAIPDGQHFASAHLRFQLLSIANAGKGLANADLYGIGVRDSNKPIASDYYQGSKSDPKATLLQAGFLTPSSKVRTDAETGPFVETNAAGDAALAQFLNGTAAKPENAGKYVIVRISYDADLIPDGNNAYMLLTTGANGDNEAPIITYTVTPAK